MNKPDPTFRRNLVGTLVVHACLIAGLVVWEAFIPNRHDDTPISIEFIPAAPLGDLPVGPGRGLGAHRAPEPPGPPSPPPQQPNSGSAADEEPVRQPAPRTPPAPVAHQVASPHEVAIPTRTSTRKPQSVAQNASTKVSSTRSKTPTRQTGTTRGPSADDFRRQLMNALGNSEGGSPSGDGRAAGGGDGSKKYGKLGYPDGAKDGVLGGVGAGSPNWQYFLHVHDRMYEAWEKPNQLLDKNLKATVLLEIASDGTINDVRLKRSSGNKIMDDTALAAARRVSRLNPPPSSLMKGSEAPVTVDFELEG
jgi:TonB family protein